MKKRRIFILSSILLSLLLILSACGSTTNNQETSSPPSSGQSSGSESPSTTESKQPETSTVEQVLRLNTSIEPATIDPARIENRAAGELSNQLFEGLVRLGEGGKVVPGAAERWEISEDGTVYTFYLNKNAKWSNGDPVTANDFVYAWIRSLKPETAAPLVNNLWFVKNGRAFNEGTLTDETQVGLKAVDDYTFQVTLEQPTAFFLELTAFYSVFPVNAKVDQANPDWSNEAETFVSNGPFKLESWKHDQEMVMVPNEYYWGRDLVKLDKIIWVMVNDQNTEYQMFKTDQLDVSGNFPNSMKNELVASGEAKYLEMARVYYLRYNNEDAIFKNAKIRNALSMALDRQLIVDKITLGGEKPAYGFIPPGLGVSLNDGDFRQLAGEKLFTDNDAENAKQLLSEGLQELGLDSLPPVTLIFSNNDTYNRLTQAMQEMWKKNLGITVELRGMESKVNTQTVKGGDYQMSLYSTSADYNDAVNLMEQWKTGDGYNYSRISIPEYDDLMTKAVQEVDLKNRAQLMFDAEKVLLDQMAIAPLYYGTSVYLQKDNVKGILRFNIQPPDYREAYKE